MFEVLRLNAVTVFASILICVLLMVFRFNHKAKYQLH